MRRVRLFRRQSLRFRITFTYILTSLLLAAMLSATTFLAVRQSLEEQRVRSTTRQTVLGLLFAREFFLGAEDSNPEDLVALLQTRSGFQTLVTTPAEFYSTTLSLTPEAVPNGLRGLVVSEEVGYQETRVERQRFLVYGAPLPPPGTDLYLFHPLEDIDNTLSVLLRVLLVVSAAAVAISAIAAQRVSARIVRPLVEVSGAARRVAEGLLETRVRTVSADEVGTLAASFNEMAAAFQEMIARERRFVANVSHELRTPLATLRTASELLQRHRADLSPGAREALDLLAEDVTNLLRLVDELMEVSSVDAGRASVRVEEVDLRAMTEAIVAKQRRTIPIHGERVVVDSDKARLERILTNLIDNAFDHGEGRSVEVRIAAGDGRATVAVSDEGPGIDADDLPHLFDRFYKADSSRTRERGGIGLGLAIAFENAKLLGGSLEAESRPRDGTTFTLALPIEHEGEGGA